ncbi:hypothetical protein HDU87_008671 [Geranomyces variabilis]|uniref:Uncharacterized protein n=1 Tax=Geranomyces variabilis TaxID=109894 RepID=A0AAD5TED0_9FUNG|nr:hypothetical protein HDU87_008671 [Geranomyces variabilis]
MSLKLTAVFETAVALTPSSSLAIFETAVALTALLTTLWPSSSLESRILTAILWVMGIFMYYIGKSEFELGIPNGTLPPRVHIAADFYLDTEEGQEYWPWEEYNAFWDQLETLPIYDQLWWTTLMTVDVSTKDALLSINPRNEETCRDALYELRAKNIGFRTKPAREWSAM